MSDLYFVYIVIITVALALVYAKIKKSRTRHSVSSAMPKKKVRFADTETSSDFQIELSDGFDLTENEVSLTTEDEVNLTTEDTWDSVFDSVLLSKKEKRDYVKKMQSNHDKLTKSMDEFDKFKNNNDNVVVKCSSIDPFKPDYRSAELKGKTIGEIYDSMIPTISAKPKKMIKDENGNMVYEDESEMNGGIIKGTNGLRAFDNMGKIFKSANFSDEF